MKLEVGDTLTLELKPDALVTVRCGDVTLTEGRMGRVGDRVAVRVAKPLRKPHTTFAMFEKADETSTTDGGAVSNVLRLTIESLVAILLLLTIALLHPRSTSSSSGSRPTSTSLQATIAELITATEIAERAIAGLKATVREADETLGERLKAAERYSIEMKQNAAAGAEVLNRLSQDRRRPADEAGARDDDRSRRPTPSPSSRRRRPSPSGPARASRTRQLAA